MKLLHLKSGTDVRGTAVSPENPAQIDLTDEAVRRISGAFARFLAKKQGKPVSSLLLSVGHDSRVSAERIRRAVLLELTAAGGLYARMWADYNKAVQWKITSEQ